MSSNAVPVLRFSPPAFLIALLLVVPAPLVAQDDAGVTGKTDEEEPPAPRRQLERIDLTVTVPKDPSDELLEQDCEDEADAGRIAGEIVVCRKLGEATDGSWNKEEWERRYAEKTKFKGSPPPPNTFGIPNHGNPISIGKVPPPAIFIDVEALPQAPAGSDADRIARGLPPLGDAPEATPAEIAERRRALGLPAPPVGGEPE